MEEVIFDFLSEWGRAIAGSLVITYFTMLGAGKLYDWMFKKNERG